MLFMTTGICNTKTSFNRTDTENCSPVSVLCREKPRPTYTHSLKSPAFESCNIYDVNSRVAKRAAFVD